jgi:hypothetical protein
MTPKRTVAGPDLTLVGGRDDEMNIYTPTGEPLGSFTDVREAWKLVDAIDTGELATVPLRRAA